MRNISIKIPDFGDELKADAFNAWNKELENIVTSTDITLDPNAGPDTDLEMLAKAIANYVSTGKSYEDTGSENTYELGVQNNLKAPSEYLDGLTVIFKAANANTANSTIEVESLGVKSLTLADGSGLSALVGIITAGEYAIAVYNLSQDRFEVLEYSPKFASIAEIVAATFANKVVSPFIYEAADIVFHPIGMIRESAESAIPFRYLLCDGSAVSRTTYSDLFALIGTTFGIGDGSTTFNLPAASGSGKTFEQLTSLGAGWDGVSVDPTTKDVWSTRQSGNNTLVYKQSAGLGSFNLIDTILNGLDSRIAVNSSTGDVWVSIDGIDEKIYKLVAGASPAVDQSAPTKNWSGIAINSVTGDVFAVFDNSPATSSTIYKRTGGIGAWNAVTTPLSRHRDITVDSATSDVWYCDIEGRTFKQTDGIGSFVEQSDFSANAFSIAANYINGDVWLGTSIGTYLSIAGSGTFALIDGTLDSEAISVDPLTGAVYVEKSFLYKRELINTIIKY